MVRRGYRQQKTDGLGRVRAREIEVELPEIRRIVDFADKLALLHDGRKRLHARNGEWQVRTAVRNDDADI